ncbi:MAG: imelysin family protein, partial [Myxococcota bacterium]
MNNRVWIAAALLITGCGDDDDKDTTTGDEFSWPSQTGEAVSTYAEIVRASYEDSVTTAQTLDVALQALVDDPSQPTLDAARQAWLDSREPYLQTEVYRFYDGPIDNPNDGPEGLLNAWPLDEQYIDYVDGDADAGIVNGEDTIDAATLESLNEVGGEKNIATGYHAIEFLLWGQDFNPDGPGIRPHTDY